VNHLSKSVVRDTEGAAKQKLHATFCGNRGGRPLPMTRWRSQQCDLLTRHITIRLTVLSQYSKSLAHHSPIEAVALQDRLERIQWRLWHGNAGEALSRARALAEDVAALASPYSGLTRLVKATGGLATYIENNVGAIMDYVERWDHSEIISTAFAESTVDLVVSRRFTKKQQMQWSKKGVHRLLQTRTRTLDGTLHDLFTTWYAAMPANDGQALPLAAAA
jgi:hypothetical protein